MVALDVGAPVNWKVELSKFLKVNLAPKLSSLLLFGLLLREPLLGLSIEKKYYVSVAVDFETDIQD